MRKFRSEIGPTDCRLVASGQRVDSALSLGHRIKNKCVRKHDFFLACEHAQASMSFGPSVQANCVALHVQCVYSRYTLYATMTSCFSANCVALHVQCVHSRYILLCKYDFVCQCSIASNFLAPIHSVMGSDSPWFLTGRSRTRPC